MRQWYVILIVVCVVYLASTSSIVAGQSPQIEDLQSEIEQTNDEIQILEREIQQYQEQLNAISSEAQTLQSAVREIDLTRQKLQSEIRLTQEEIQQTDTEIQNLQQDIRLKNKDIDGNTLALAKSIQRLQELESRNLFEALLAEETLSTVWTYIGNIHRFQKQLQKHTSSLIDAREDLVSIKTQIESKKEELVTLRGNLEEQKRVVDVQREEKAALLKTTENQEQNYRALIEEKRRLKEEFENDLHSFQSQLEYILDPTSIPQAGNVVFSWPLEYVYITQRFGLTPYSERLYSYRSGAFKGKHTGIDFRTNGDAVYAMGSGSVVGAGNTDTTCRGASFGKWVLIEYDNGLASIYSHLSVISAKAGERVSRDTVVGYSGNTGYSTAAHLDIKVVPADAVSIETWPSNGCPGAYYTTPIVRDSAYLNPLSYLPNTTPDMYKPGA